MKIYLYLLLSLFVVKFLSSQCALPTNLLFQSDIPVPMPLLQHNMTAHRDTAASKPFLYVAGKERGLVVYNISNTLSPILTSSILPSSMLNLDVMNLTQAGNYLYLALGDHFNASAQKSGMAIVDITNPIAPVLKSTYSFTANSGAGHVAVEGNYAYLSAMQNGILVFDVTIKTSIVLVSVFKPTINFPKVGPTPSELQKINVRNIVAKNNILYTCYDAGGVRIINATNKLNLVETGKYSNPLLNTKARAYNNLVLKDSLIFVAADYCGMEILNVKDTSNIVKIGWWNPWKCETPSNTWFNSTGHANEIEYDPICKLVFLSTGKSDMHVVNVSNPLLPDSCSRFGNTIDSLGSWGLGRYNNEIYLAYISTWPLYIPFAGKASSIKIITYNNACTILNIKESHSDLKILAYPNPNNGLFEVELSSSTQVIVTNNLGQILINETMNIGKQSIDIQNQASGIYFVKFTQNGNPQTIKLIKK